MVEKFEVAGRLRLFVTVAALEIAVITLGGGNYCLDTRPGQ